MVFHEDRPRRVDREHSAARCLVHPVFGSGARIPTATPAWERVETVVGLRFRWRPFLVALGCLAVGAATLWSVHPPVYQTNDDVSIRLALEGRTAPGEPATGFTALTHAGLGWSVAYLYRILPNAPWWDLVVASMLLVAIAVVAAIVWDALGCAWLPRATSQAALLIAAVPLLGSFHFTVGATLGGATAVLLALVEACRVRPRWGVLAMAALLLVAALLVRTLGAASGIVAAGLLCTPLVLTRGWALRPVALVLVVAVLLCAAVQYVDEIAYQMDDQWARYHRYQWILVRLFEWRGDLPQGERDVIRATVGWTPNDWQMIPGYFGVDPNVHGYERVARAYETSTANCGWADCFTWARDRLTRLDLPTVRTILTRSGATLVATSIVAVAYASRRGAVATVVVAAFFLALCVGIETAFKELPIRVLGPLQACAVAVSLITVSASRRRPSPVLAVLALGLVLSVLRYQFTETTAAAEAFASDAQALDQEMNDLRRISPSLLVLHADTFPREQWWRPFHASPGGPPSIALGWNNQYPSLQSFLRKSGMEGLLTAMCSDPSVLVIAEEGRLDVVTTFFHEHHNAQIGWTQVYDGSFPAWRCSLVEPP